MNSTAFGATITAVPAPDESALAALATVATPQQTVPRGSGPMGVPTFSCATFSCL